MTAMQELIFWGKVLLKKYPENQLSFSEVIDKAEMLLELEHKLTFITNISFVVMLQSTSYIGCNYNSFASSR